ncbi:unnamed protein product [Cylicocyclus nassatus]|uniref:Apple domain-containing protein n=1 Tax=Cylicocyclus nassatus TaxID=53992 RepID=A0AA36GWA9_CYLNA|nr:unnamed protein product [Cylicocyclus nassatus]
MMPTRFLLIFVLVIVFAISEVLSQLRWSRTCTKELINGKWMENCKMIAKSVCPPELLEAGITICASPCTFTETKILWGARELISFEDREEQCYAECLRYKDCNAVLYLTNNWCYLFGIGPIIYGPVGPGTYYILHRNPMEPNCLKTVPVPMLKT